MTAKTQGKSAQPANKRRRLQIDLSEEGYNRLCALQQATGDATTSDVVRSALRLYAWYIDQKREGWILQLVDKERTKAREIELFFE